MRKVAAFLSDAARAIETLGHAKGVYKDSLGGVCLVGALYVADGSIDSPMLNDFPTYLMAKRLLNDVAITEWEPLSWFNDAEQTTSADVINRILEAASLAMDGA